MNPFHSEADWRKSNWPIQKRVRSLLETMTIQEKIGQMCQIVGSAPNRADLVRAGRVGSFLNIAPQELNAIQRIAVEESRLGIPVIVGRDVIHGFNTIFPIPIAQAASFDPEIVRLGARVAAREAAAHGIRWAFAPMVDISRGPRWGRIAEGFGEDPVLAGRLGAAMVRGFQGDDLSAPNSIAACVKHYVGYGAAEGGRDYNTTLIPESELRNIYLAPFRECFKAGALTFMSGFNDLNGISTSGNQHTLREILKNEWGFEGFVVSDWCSVRDLILHGYAEDEREAAQRAIAAGVDMEMVSDTYLTHAEELVDSGALSVEWIDEAVARILRVKFLLGLFERPYFDGSSQLSVGEKGKSEPLRGIVLDGEPRFPEPLL